MRAAVMRMDTVRINWSPYFSFWPNTSDRRMNRTKTLDWQNALGLLMGAA